MHTYYVFGVLEPDPAGSIWVFDNAEPARRRQASRQVIEPPRLIGVDLALVIVPCGDIGVISYRGNNFKDNRPGSLVLLIAPLSRKTIDRVPRASTAMQCS